MNGPNPAIVCLTRDPDGGLPHCWHWDALRGCRREPFEVQRICCFCGRIGLAIPRTEDQVEGHGPLLTPHGGDANGAEFVE